VYDVAVRGGGTVANERETQMTKQEVIKRVAHALDTIRYGEIAVKIQGGKPVLVERREQEKVG